MYYYCIIDCIWFVVFCLFGDVICDIMVLIIGSVSIVFLLIMVVYELKSYRLIIKVKNI